MRLTECGEGRAAWSPDVGERFHNAKGTLHGGILCDLADAAMGVACLTTLKAGEPLRTVEEKINFPRPVRAQLLTAAGRVARAGRTLALTESDVMHAEGRLVARASSTCVRLGGR